LIAGPDDPGMSIVARRGRVVAEPRSRLLRFERPVPVVVAAGTIGSSIPAAVDVDPDDPRHELARLALDLVVRTSEPLSLPLRWATVPFGREVDRTRAQLAPIRTRAALATSFSREASVAVTRFAEPAPLMPPGPVRVAYAIRWLELGDDRSRPAWASIANGVVADLAAAIDPVRQRIGDSTR
jgi:hypothetical protein